MYVNGTRAPLYKAGREQLALISHDNQICVYKQRCTYAKIINSVYDSIKVRARAR